MQFILNCKNAALADQELHQQFEDMVLGDVGFAHGTTHTLHNGMFLYSEGSTPSNFTAFSFFEQQPLERDDVCKRALFLILVSAVGQEKSLDDIKKSAKQTVRVPTDFVGLQNQLGYWKGACRIFLVKTVSC
mmetsp:Transcript_24275/g.35971  ORF Transcript_24275/g.35971 Transcript_24275/m.35971 type:complete len:132 (+) Transcript_24275:635-1030(+)